MNDAERIYALYVQANPVPDPGLLAATRDEPVLLERSEDMITHEPVESQPVFRPRRRNVLVAAGAFAAVVVAGLVTVLLVTGDEPGPVAAADAQPEIVFDGTTCTYDGPTRIEEGTIELTAINSSDEYFTIALWRMEGDALEAELLRTPVGTDMALAPGDPIPDGSLISTLRLAQDATQTTSLGPLLAGSYLVDCVTQAPNGIDDHVWRPARIEVVAP